MILHRVECTGDKTKPTIFRSFDEITFKVLYVILNEGTSCEGEGVGSWVFWWVITADEVVCGCQVFHIFRIRMF
jgi:hypothetical protein